MNTKEQQDKEYRAQWIRDAARDLLIARENGCALPLPSVVGAPIVVKHVHSLASSLWDRYVEERK